MKIDKMRQNVQKPDRCHILSDFWTFEEKRLLRAKPGHSNIKKTARMNVLEAADGRNDYGRNEYMGIVYDCCRRLISGICGGESVDLPDKRVHGQPQYVPAVSGRLRHGDVWTADTARNTAKSLYWWDYSKIPLHITRYTSLPTSTLFACAITVFMDHVLAPLYGYFLSWDSESLRAATIVMTLLLTGDFLYNACLMYQRQGMIRRWRVDMPRFGLDRNCTRC